MAAQDSSYATDFYVVDQRCMSVALSELMETALSLRKVIADMKGVNVALASPAISGLSSKDADGYNRKYTEETVRDIEERIATQAKSLADEKKEKQDLLRQNVRLSASVGQGEKALKELRAEFDAIRIDMEKKLEVKDQEIAAYHENFEVLERRKDWYKGSQAIILDAAAFFEDQARALGPAFRPFPRQNELDKIRSFAGGVDSRPPSSSELEAAAASPPRDPRTRPPPPAADGVLLAKTQTKLNQTLTDLAISRNANKEITAKAAADSLEQRRTIASLRAKFITTLPAAGADVSWIPAAKETLDKCTNELSVIDKESKAIKKLMINVTDVRSYAMNELNKTAKDILLRVTAVERLGKELKVDGPLTRQKLEAHIAEQTAPEPATTSTTTSMRVDALEKKLSKKRADLKEATRKEAAQATALREAEENCAALSAQNESITSLKEKAQQRFIDERTDLRKEKAAAEAGWEAARAEVSALSAEVERLGQEKKSVALERAALKAQVSTFVAAAEEKRRRLVELEAFFGHSFDHAPDFAQDPGQPYSAHKV